MGIAPVERAAMNLIEVLKNTLGRTIVIAVAAWFGCAATTSLAATDAVSPRGTLLLVLGAPGEAEYGSNFLQQATIWEKDCLKAGFTLQKIGLDDTSATNDCELLRQSIASEVRESPHSLWLVLIGHGSFDGKEARFNLRGPDLTASDLATWLQPFKRPLVIINTSSCSAPFLNKLSATNRVVLTATRSGHEQNYTRFGEHFVKALTDPDADLDKDNQVSLLEAFIIASRRTAEFYKTEGRLATEHALLDDNGDGLGTQGDWFRGLRAVKKPSDKASVDGLSARQIQLIASPEDDNLSAEQLRTRDQLERDVLVLREKKSELPETEYTAQLERVLLQLAHIYESAANK